MLSELLIAKEIAVVAVAFAGFVIYAALAFVFGAIRPAEIRGALRRERTTPSDDLPDKSAD